MHHVQHEQRSQHDDHEAGPDDVPAPESHEKHDHQDHDDYRFDEVYHEDVDGTFHPCRLEEYFLKINPRRNDIFFQLGQFGVHFFPQLKYIPTFFHGNRNRDGRQGIV